jgi:hypothetical protein
MRTVVALALMVAACCLAWIGSEPDSSLPKSSKYAEYAQSPAGTFAALAVVTAFVAGLLV